MRVLVVPQIGEMDHRQPAGGIRRRADGDDLAHDRADRHARGHEAKLLQEFSRAAAAAQEIRAGEARGEEEVPQHPHRAPGVADEERDHPVRREHA